MSVHRLPACSAALAEERPALTREAQRHLRVVRPKDGETVELFDGRGGRRFYEYRAGALRAAGPERREQPPKVRTSLYACVTKGQRWDWTVQKATELGVAEIVPVVSERTIARVAPGEGAAKRERWLKIAQEAARQSDAAWTPDVAEPLPFAAAAERAAATRCFAGVISDPPPPPILEALRALPPDAKEISLFVGPEGDFSPEELDVLRGFAAPVSFGPSILRAETAAVFGLSAIKAFLDVSAR